MGQPNPWTTLMYSVVVPGPWLWSRDASRTLLGGLSLVLGSGNLDHSDYCSVMSVCDGESYFRPYLSQLVCIPRCLTVLQAVAIHWWVDLCSGYSRCCSSRVLILVLRLLVLVLVLALKWSCLHHWLCTTTRSNSSNNNSSSNLFTGRTSGQGTAIGRVRPVRLFPL